MRIIRSSDLPAVVLVKGRGQRIVAIPESLSPDEVVELASLVLSASEYEEFRYAVEAASPSARHPELLPRLSTPRPASRSRRAGARRELPA